MTDQKQCCEKCLSDKCQVVRYEAHTPLFCNNSKCPCHQPKGTWEEEFDEKFTNKTGRIEFDEIKSFIRSLLADRVREIRVKITPHLQTIRIDGGGFVSQERYVAVAILEKILNELSSPLVDEKV